jgi:hypothetical protein
LGRHLPALRRSVPQLKMSHDPNYMAKAVGCALPLAQGSKPSGLMGLGPYPTLAIFLVPITGLEPKT